MHVTCVIKAHGVVIGPDGIGVGQRPIYNNGNPPWAETGRLQYVPLTQMR